MPIPTSSEHLNKTPAVTFHASTRKRVQNGVSAASGSPMFPRTPGTKTPSTTRSAAVGNKTPGTRAGAVGTVTVNDDEAERRQRRLQNNMNAMMSPGCHTPKNVPKTPSSRVNAVESSTSSLSNTQIAEHYANCIKLSTQNKISSKNAFGLHLIDHMLQLLKVRGEMKNFQVASSTLDAGAKIYAGRVDSMYNDIFKILTGMGTKTTQGGEGDGESATTDGGETAVQPRRKHRRGAGSTAVVVEKNPKALDMNTSSLEFAVDPLFKKMSAAFDEGGVAGLLHNNLFVLDDGCYLVFQTDATPGTMGDIGDGVETDVEEIADLIAPDVLQDLQIYSQSFSSFLYSSGDNTPFSPSKAGSMPNTLNTGSTDVDYSMLQCPPQVPDTTLVPEGNDDYDDNDGGGGGGMDFDHLDGTVLGVPNDNQMAQYISSNGKQPEQSAPVDAQKEKKDLFLMDALEPTEYSYFNPAVVAAWAGPQHWKIGARNVDRKGDQSAPKKRTAAAQFRIDFTQELDSSLLSVGKASTQLSRSALAKMKGDQATLPPDPHSNANTLHKLFCRPKWKVTRQCKRVDAMDDGPANVWYNYSNVNDSVNYCPLPNQDMDNDDDDCFESGGIESQEYDTGFECDQTNAPPPVLRDDNSQLLAGDRLLTPPRKVEQIRIDYARNAKKIDVKKLKLKIWEILNDDPSDTTTDEATSANTPEARATTCKFNTMYSTLPTKLSAAMAKNVSVSICFVCLLHLANEKDLVISGEDDLSDLHICTCTS